MMTDSDDILSRHDRLARYLDLNINDLEHEFATTSRLLQEAGELSARANQQRNNAKHDYELAIAETSLRVRDGLLIAAGKDVAQTKIDSELRIVVPLAPEVRDARLALNHAIYVADACETMAESYKQKCYLMTKSADMVLSGYINTGVLDDEQRAERVRKMREHVAGSAAYKMAEAARDRWGFHNKDQREPFARPRNNRSE